MNSLLRRIFDVCLHSEIALPGLVACECLAPDWEIVLAPNGSIERELAWFHTWTSPDGAELMKAARENGDYWLDILGQATFRIRFGEHRIEVRPGPGCDETTLAHLLADQVLPRAICHAGRAVVHASAVLLPDGRAVAFTGPSGRGKSTLATAFHKAGHAVLADDCLLLERAERVVTAVPAYPSLRLWPDSLEALAGGAGDGDWTPLDMAHYSNKKQLLPEEGNAPGQSTPVELAALFILREPHSAAGANVRIDPAGGSRAIMAVVEALFALDVRDRTVVQRNFETVGQVTGAVPAFEIHYPRDFSFLPEVIDSIGRLISIS